MGRLSRFGAPVVRAVAKWLSRVPPPWQRLLGVASLVLAIGVAVMLVVWALPSVLTRHPHIADAADRHKAITDTRTGLVAALAAIGAAGGLAFTARTYRLSREGHITDRYSKAVEQLGDDKIEVRLGGIYALERLMRDSPSDQLTIMETLAAFVRQHARHNLAQTRPVEDSEVSEDRQPDSASTTDYLAEDVQAILNVLGRRHPVDNEGAIDLRRTNLAGARLTGANLTGAELDEVNLTGAELDKVNLTGAGLRWTDLTGARLTGANLTGAILGGATLTHAWLGGANLTGAFLGAANLTGAFLNGANLTGAGFSAEALSEDQLAMTRHADKIEWF